MTQPRRAALAGLFGGLVIVSCSNAPTGFDDFGATSTAVPVVPTDPVPTDPPTPEQTQPAPVEPITLAWPDPLVRSDSFVEPIFDGASVLVTTALSTNYEGAEGGQLAHARLDLVDTVSGDRITVVEQLPENTGAVAAGPGGRAALLIGADANGSVTEFFTIGVDGQVTDRVVLDDPVRFGANDTTNPSWSSDGSVFHIQGQAVDSRTGTPTAESQLVFGEDESGNRLVGSDGDDQLMIGWSDEDQDDVEVDRYPMPELAWSSDGRVLALIGPWERATTLIVDGDARRIDGWAWPSPDGSRLAIESTDGTLVISDITGEPIAVIELPDAWRRVAWLGDDRLLVADQQPGGHSDLRVISLDG